ncbi:Endothelin-converting enzyme 1 protein [Dioscorea alata]|uniref:Endothelin-converting enzyme 1 protein n=1 Tax=Dioscorea alata TaxID=55571 RepID=A0ACB7UW42_DIOAL|nr:Endothelin-converting enzyme 1 protein [Dioscorea alata]
MEMEGGERGKDKGEVAPRTVSDYLDPHYWNERFKSEEHYEWFKDYSHFQHLLRRHIHPSYSVLELGCGNSRLCEELFKDGVTDITCIDLSDVAVNRMRERLLVSGLHGIKVLQADMLELPFSSQSFDLVIEKGTMDVLFVDSGDPWNPNPSTVSKVMKMLEGVHKVLKPQGTFISITFGQPHFRRPLFESPGFTWSVEWDTFGDGFHYFFYFLKKGRRSPESEPCHDEKRNELTISMLHEELEDEDYIFRTAIDVMEN